MGTLICIDPVHYFHCAGCEKLQPREREEGEKLKFCLECSKIVCDACQKEHKHKLFEITPKDLNSRLTEAYTNYMPHLFPENLGAEA